MTGAPLLPADVDLRGFDFMPVYILQLQQSRAYARCYARHELFWPMFNLWHASWWSVPAASIDDDEAVIAGAARCSMADWQKYRGWGAFAGWEQGRDGRWYHRALAAIAWEKWLDKLIHTHGLARDRARKHNRRPGAEQMALPDLQNWIEQTYPVSAAALHRGFRADCEHSLYREWIVRPAFLAVPPSSPEPAAPPMAAPPGSGAVAVPAETPWKPPDFRAPSSGHPLENTLKSNSKDNHSPLNPPLPVAGAVPEGFAPVAPPDGLGRAEPADFERFAAPWLERKIGFAEQTARQVFAGFAAKGLLPEVARLVAAAEGYFAKIAAAHQRPLGPARFLRERQWERELAQLERRDGAAAQSDAARAQRADALAAARAEEALRESGERDRKRAAFAARFGDAAAIIDRKRGTFFGETWLHDAAVSRADGRVTISVRSDSALRYLRPQLGAAMDEAYGPDNWSLTHHGVSA
jgi:hypothetical protein